MNKLLVVLLAVCLVSVHAFVKRDTAAPAAGNDNILENIKNELSSAATKINDELSKTFDPEKIKNEFSAMVDKLNEAVNSLKPKEAPKA